MSYQIGSLVLPNPIGFQRRTVETSGENLSITGRTTKDIRNRKEQYVLEFDNLTKTEVDNIFVEYDAQTVKDFTVNETNLTINATSVQIDIPNRDYIKGADYRQKLRIILTEVV